jgi:imidazolonepropionase-like amidohydrolase
MHFRGMMLVLTWVASVSCLAQTSAPQLIRDVRVFDGNRILEHRSVLIENGTVHRIYRGAANVPNARLTDGSGRTLLPGLIDAHVHLPDQAKTAAQQALKFGVTTQLDMFSAGERLKEIKRIEAEDASDCSDVRTAATGATVADGHPTQMGGPAISTISGPAEAQDFVDARIAEGSDYIKIIHDDGSTWPWKHDPVSMLDNRTMQALVVAAHKRGKLAVVHALSEAQARDAILAGADGLAHLFIGESVSPDFGEMVAAHHVFVIPTLSTIYLNCGKSLGSSIAADPHLSPHIGKDAAERLTMAKADPSANQLCIGTDEAMRELVRAHVMVLAGTDAPAPGTTYGASLHGELELLVRDGLSPVQALAAATSLPAHAFHLNDRGVIKRGARADLLLVEGDPSRDIRDTRNIVAVWKRGVKVAR